MQKLALLCEAIAGTTKKLEKTALVAGYMREQGAEEAAISAVFLSGRAFPVWEERTLQVGGALLWKVLSQISGRSEPELHAEYRKFGDLGGVAGAVWPAKGLSQLSAEKVRQAFDQVAAARGPSQKGPVLTQLFTQATPLEAKYLVKIITGDLRIGLKESLVEEAIAKAYDAPLGDVQRANLLLGDIGETLRLAAVGKLSAARMRLFHPLGFMLASAVDSAEDALNSMAQASIEDKYDGIRAQAHFREGEVRIFSRTRDDITESFPEVAAALSRFRGEAVLDGEIVAWKECRAMPFTAIQQRLGRKLVSDELMREVPVAYLVFDLLYADGQLFLDHSLAERGAELDRLMKAPRSGLRYQAKRQRSLFQEEQPLISEILRAPVRTADTAAALNGLFEAALQRGNEGLMIKDPASRYAPGRRGKSWLKMKRELATLDVVVTAAEYGHGKRIGVLSDYTFAVRDGEQLRNVGKAYSGLTDKEIDEMTAWFLQHTVHDQGFRREVEPEIVLEVAFNNVMESDRHESGYALRFPRIVRIRKDKLPAEIDTLDRVREIYESQKKV
jgi:DNA ligase-1